MLTCPACGKECVAIADYDEMMVLRPDLALFKLTCPSCGISMSSLRPIPKELMPEVEAAAREIGAGMGREG